MDEDKKKELMTRFMSKVPSSLQKVFKRAYSGKSKASGIKAKCLDCVGFQRIEVAECEAVTCQLFQYRPYKPEFSGKTIENKEISGERQKRVLSSEQKEAMQKGRKNKQNPKGITQ